MTSAGEDVEEREPSYMVDGGINQYSQLWKTVWGVLKKLKKNFYMTKQLISGLLSEENKNINLKRYAPLCSC